ncbi:TPA: TcfC E-set like domain-containing protein [Aeromonas veronii]|nr:TcfC E-set like domain-containing protein [Aeromonas veronii]
MKLRHVGLMLMCVSKAAAASDYPIEFTDFFTPKKTQVMVSLAGDTIGQRIEAEVSYESFRLVAGQEESASALRRYLTDNQLTNSAIDTILAALSEGVPADPGCKVALDVCKPIVVGEQVSYVFDVDHGNLTIYVGSKLLTRSPGEVQYHSAARANNALVNQARLYSYADDIGARGFNAANLTTLGLPYGFMQFNTQYQNTDNQFDVYRGVYDLEVQGVRAVVGYAERDRVQFNATDFLNDDANYTALTAQVGTSRNLIKGGAASVQAVDFFAPQAGQLEVYQGDRLLLSQVVSPGRQSISYSDLPSGAYDVTLVLKSAGSVVIEERRQIVNTQLFSLPVDAWDVVATAGRLGDIPAQHELGWLYAPERMSTNFGQVRTAWRVADGVLLAGALTSNQDDWYAQLGTSVAWSDWLHGAYQVGQFSSDDVYQSGTLGIGSLFLSARRFDSNVNNRWYRLSSALYGERSYFNYSATYSAQLGNGSGYVTYSRYESEDPYTLNELQLSRGDNISVGWTVSLFGGTLGLNSSYNKSDNNDNLSAGVYWSYALGDKWSSQLSLMSDKSGVSRTETGMTRTIHQERWSGAATTTASWVRDQERQGEGAFSAMASGTSDWFTASTYGYASSAGQHMVSGTLTGSQFVSVDGAGMSYEQSPSFIHVVPDIQLAPDGDAVSLDDIHYNVRRGKRTTYQGNLGQSNAVISLMPYTDTEFAMDAEARSVDIEQPTRREFVYPGTVYTIDTRITPLVSQLFVLSDIQGHPVTQARCVGEGCQSIERLSDDGVFRVNCRRGGDMKLMSMNRVCINSPELMRGEVVYTYCLPGLDENEGRIALSRKGVVGKGEFLYLGKYAASQDAQAILTKLKSVGLATHSVVVGSQLYIYVKHSKQYTVAQRSLLEGMDAYIVLNEADMNKLFSAR